MLQCTKLGRICASRVRMASQHAIDDNAKLRRTITGACRAGRSVLYLLLAIGAAQFVVSWVMGATVHSPAVAKQVVDSTLPWHVTMWVCW